MVMVSASDSYTWNYQSDLTGKGFKGCYLDYYGYPKDNEDNEKESNHEKESDHEKNQSLHIKIITGIERIMKYASLFLWSYL